MGNNAAPGGASNEGKTDIERGNVLSPSVTKADRKTGQVGSVSTGPNPNTVDGTKRTVSDPRLV